MLPFNLALLQTGSRKFYILARSPAIPCHTSVRADRPSLATVRYPSFCSYFSLLDAGIWDVSCKPLFANINSLLSNCNYSLLALWLVLAAFCTLLAERLMAILASRSSSTLFLDCCRSFRAVHSLHRQLFSLTIFIARRSLRDVCSTLFPFCYWKLLTGVYLFAVRSPLTVRFLLLASSSFCIVACLSLLTARWTNASYMPLAITCSLLKVYRSLFWDFDSVQGFYVFFKSLKFSSDKNTAVDQ